MYDKKIIDNNVRLITAPLSDTRTASILVLIRVGSRNEDKKNNGVSHFIEHLMFKGTKNRPNTIDLSKELDGVGAEFNAFTGKDYTGYYIKSDYKHLTLAIDILSDMLENSLFDEKELEREKGVIIEEINMYEDNPIMHVDSLLEQAMYDGHPLGYDIAGTKDTVKGINRKDLVDFKNKFYGGNNVVITLAGNFKDSHIDDIKSKFKFKLVSKTPAVKKITINQKSPRVSLKFKETEQTQIALGFPAYSYTDKRIYALKLLTIVLGGNMSSRLFVQIRERNGLAYFVRASLGVYEDTGGLVIQSGLDKSRVDKALKLIIAELKKIKKGVTKEELKRAKEYLFGKTALDLEDSSHICQWYAQQELMTGKMLSPEERNKKIAAVSQKDIIDVACDVIDMNKSSLAIIGPFKDSDKFLNLLK